MITSWHESGVDILPDSRVQNKEVHGWIGPLGWVWVDIYCASCHKPWGAVPAENINFVMFLCDDCYLKYGEIAGTYSVPEEVFWRAVNAEMMEKYGRLLPPEELQEIIDSGIGSIAALFKERPHK